MRFDRRRPKPKGRMTQEDAEALAAQALAFLTEDEQRLVRFLSLSGMSPADLARQAGETGTLGAVIDHLAADDSLLLVFTSGAGIEPTDVLQAQAVLSGWHEGA